MQHHVLQRITEISSSAEEQGKSVTYLAKQFAQMIVPGEHVLVCFPKGEQAPLGLLLEKAILQCSGVPIFWENDFRWNALLKLTFLSRASTIIGFPLTLLGLSKLAAYRGTPLSIRNAVLTGYPCMDWMMDGLISGLDCQIWGMISTKLQTMVAGFSCRCSNGFHIRDDVYGVDIVDKNNKSVAPGATGNVVLYPRKEPDVRLRINAYGWLETAACPCGNPLPKLSGLDYGDSPRAPAYRIAESLLYWNSILDCRVDKTGYGLEIEVVAFPGLQLPRFPDCAKLVVRTWNPDTDVPLEFAANWEKVNFVPKED